MSDSNPDPILGRLVDRCRATRAVVRGLRRVPAPADRRLRLAHVEGLLAAEAEAKAAERRLLAELLRRPVGTVWSDGSVTVRVAEPRLVLSWVERGKDLMAERRKSFDPKAIDFTEKS